ncbi:PREDICTED: UDP-glycosyltransferase 84A4-like isoform X1 [Camelina sativa]|uniref:Glycosyltransferase n=1 Tax=Camelina sativa TaxID=90675 RepID=A0ABM1QSC0_CAMSA|nr:PREDICTED: UDP-glycosyltransferase 84A4-like isoform X1 [Camelina sativa]
MEMEMEMGSSLTHVMLISFPGQGHINPLLRLGKLIASKGLLVTFVTTEEPLGKKMREANKIQDGVLKPVGLGFLRFEFFDDGFVYEDMDLLLKSLEVAGKREIKNLVKKYEKQPVKCLINNAFVPWVCDVAEELQIPSAVLWVQSCACLAAYYYYHHQLVKFPTETEPEITTEIPFKPLVLKHDEIPSFLHPSSPLPSLGGIILEQIKRLHKPFSVLIDTFEELERDTIDHMSQLCPQVIIKSIGPLFTVAKSISSDIKGDISEPASDCIEWLDSKEPSSVVYISFGTIVRLKQEQIEEIAHGILNSGLSCLWVVRPPLEALSQEPQVLPRELEEKGKIVEWCPQEKVLAHPAVACFLSHCGWNSTMEALTSGAPLICFPQWGDQVTNAVYMIDVFKTGLRLSRGEAEKRIVLREEVTERLLEATVGEKAVELRENARRWKEAAESAVAYGGSSERNLQEFVDKLVDVKIMPSISN